MKNNIKNITSSKTARKLVLYVLLASTVITIFTSAYQLYSTYTTDVSEIELRLEEIKKSYVGNISTRVWVANQEELAHSLAGILRLSDIEYIEVYEEGELITKQGKIPKRNFIIREFPLYYTFKNKQQKIGSIKITASLESAYQRLINQAINILFSNALKTFLLSSFILFLVYRYFLRHIQVITKYAEDINLKNLTSRIILDREESRHHDHDEIDMLVDAIHSMQINLNTAAVQIEVNARNLKNILDSMNDAVITIDVRGNIQSFNKSAENLFGYEGKEILGENVKVLMPDSVAMQHDGYLKHYFDTGEKRIIGQNREVLGQNKNKETFPMKLSVAELKKDIDGEQYYIGTCHDITQEKKKEEQLQRSQKMDALGKLTGGIAHDYNNMLGIVLGYAELAKDSEHVDDKIVKYLDQIERAATRGVALTKKLLSFSKSKSEGEASLDINKLILDQEDLLKKTLTVRIQIDINLQSDIWTIVVDSNELEDAILNMSINAMHAMEGSSSKLKLGLHTRNKTLSAFDAYNLNLEQGEYVLFSVIDTGKGMDEDIQNKIFEPFFSTKGELGTGLGLSQVFGFVKRAGGTITVYSELGKGTQFDIYFPRSINEAEDIDSSEDSANLYGTETILVVDDEEALCSMTATILKSKGYKVFTAESGQMALEIIERENINLLLTDVIMPNMDGYQLANRVQKYHPKIKIQIMSGFTNDLYKHAEDKKLHENVIKKPFSSHTLLASVRALFDDKKSL